MDEASVAGRVAKQLAPYLGPFNAQVAVKTYAKSTFQIAPEDVAIEHVPLLIEALRPMLTTFAGRASTDLLMEKIKREVK
jgi:hypothetical protein